MKLKYHKNNNWEDRFITETRKAITVLYEKQYVPVTTNVIETDNHPEDDLFSHIYKKRRQSNENELDLYLATPIVPGNVDVLQWWKV